MSHRRILWVLAGWAILVLVVGCNRQETPQVEAAKSPSGSERQATPAEQNHAQGKQVYQESCAACHDTGLSGAPKLGDTPAWSHPLAKGTEPMVNSVINGLGKMPPKGGDPSLSEAEIRAAVDYMIEQVQ